MRVLISSPEFDNATRYLRAWSRRLAIEIGKTHTVIHAEGKRATRSQICSILKKKQVDVVVINGHGADDCIAGHDNEILIDASNVDLLSGKIVHALSCDTARTLGGLAMRAGANGYVGYDEKFLLITNATKLAVPLDDKRAALFLNPAFIAPKALIDGKSPAKAVELTKKAFQRSIKDALNSDVQSDDDKCVPYLWWNLSHLKFVE